MGRKKLDLILENVKIEAVAAEGKSLAHVDGTVVFVEFAVPGDIVNVKVTKKKKNYMEGFILEIVKPSRTGFSLSASTSEYAEDAAGNHCLTICS